MLFFALYKCKRNGGRGQTTSGVNATGDDDNGDSSSGQIAMGPTSLAFSTTYHGLLRKITFMHVKKRKEKLSSSRIPSLASVGLL